VTYAEFWPRYLKAHDGSRTRALHYLGTGAGTVLLAAFVATRDRRLLVAAPVLGYACAWIGHAVFERNRPETFGHPLWSLYSDFRMLTLFLAGRLPAEMRRVGRQEGR
jgi:hypothetical protein